MLSAVVPHATPPIPILFPGSLACVHLAFRYRAYHSPYCHHTDTRFCAAAARFSIEPARASQPCACRLITSGSFATRSIVYAYFVAFGLGWRHATAPLIPYRAAARQCGPFRHSDALFALRCRTPLFCQHRFMTRLQTATADHCGSIRHLCCLAFHNRLYAVAEHCLRASSCFCMVRSSLLYYGAFCHRWAGLTATPIPIPPPARLFTTTPYRCRVYWRCVPDASGWYRQHHIPLAHAFWLCIRASMRNAVARCVHRCLLRSYSYTITSHPTFSVLRFKWNGLLPFWSCLLPHQRPYPARVAHYWITPDAHTLYLACVHLPTPRFG